MEKIMLSIDITYDIEKIDNFFYLVGSLFSYAARDAFMSSFVQSFPRFMPGHDLLSFSHDSLSVKNPVQNG